MDKVLLIIDKVLVTWAQVMLSSLMAMRDFCCGEGDRLLAHRQDEAAAAAGGGRHRARDWEEGDTDDHDLCGVANTRGCGVQGSIAATWDALHDGIVPEVSLRVVSE